ncbi:Transient receptor potential cation channel subfamily V member 6 [Aphelenchoides bicaudatus]|nr:Transient receptor potential cation channel subfamily V member 6 [Aphelenchoides bicaudatus]
METKVRDMMYNSGKGKLESVAELVKRRNKERNERLSAFNRKKGKGKSGPNILDDFNQEANQGDLKKALKLLDGGKGGKGDAKYREIVWKLDERGSMGENIVGCCLMQGGAMHTKLALKMFEMYPKLTNDIFISEDYYGLSPLHQAVVNEDPWLVAYLLHRGADINQRCYGSYFCPDDQISSRTDSLEHEYVEVNVHATNYKGKMYFGEYPLAFAACTNQEDCYRILRAKKADPNAQDTNGNTVLHMTVIHENLAMFRLAFSTGARLQIMNKQSLTPLTLAAKLAKRTMFEQILQLESYAIWQYGDASSTAFPLARIDTINQETGELNEDSALSLIETKEHLDLLDGLLEELLQAKWKAFGRKRWIYSFCAFSIYYIIFFTAFMCRPFSWTSSVILKNYVFNNGSFAMVVSDADLTSQYQSFLGNDSKSVPVIFQDYTNSKYLQHAACHLWNYSLDGFQGQVRMYCECIVFWMVVVQIIMEIRDIHNIGRRRWWQVLKSFPAKILYKVSLFLTLAIVPIRCMCGLGDTWLLIDNMFSLLSVILTTLHFLFYCRAVKFVGPFVLMVYTIITRDMIRFFLIYFIFLMGFSQGFYIIFKSCHEGNMKVFNDSLLTNNTMKMPRNIMPTPQESLIRLFVVTIGEFTVFYREMNNCSISEKAILGEQVLNRNKFIQDIQFV